jgi:DNA-directed RNA polymerase specialized sigma24 family protein
VTLTTQQRAQVLYLYYVEAVSLVLIAQMTELSLSTVMRVVDKTRRKDVKRKEKAAASPPSSPQQSPSPRRSRRERRHDRA